MDNSSYNENGDMLAKDGMVFRRIGWQINGGVNDGLMVSDEEIDIVKSKPHGSFSPIYVEIGD